MLKHISVISIITYTPLETVWASTAVMRDVVELCELCVVIELCELCVFMHAVEVICIFMISQLSRW